MVRSLFTVFLTSEAVRDFLTLGLATGRTKLQQMFREGQSRGEDSRPHSTRGPCVAFSAVPVGCMFLWTLQKPAPPLDAWLDEGFDFFWSGVTALPAKRSKR